MCFLLECWEAAKNCCGPKRLYATAGVLGVLVLAAVVSGVVVPLRRRAAAAAEAAVVTTSAPGPLLVTGGNVQVQGLSHSLVHIQEGITAGDARSRSGSLGGSDRICHLGLLVVIGVCCVSFLILLGYQLMQFRPRTAEMPDKGPEEAARRWEVMAGQLRERMVFEMRQLGVPVGS